MWFFRDSQQELCLPQWYFPSQFLLDGIGADFILLSLALSTALLWLSLLAVVRAQFDSGCYLLLAIHYFTFDWYMFNKPIHFIPKLQLSWFILETERIVNSFLNREKNISFFLISCQFYSITYLYMSSLSAQQAGGGGQKSWNIWN